MKAKQIVYVPGNNPKPEAEQHRELPWGTLPGRCSRLEIERYFSNADGIAREIHDLLKQMLAPCWIR